MGLYAVAKPLSIYPGQNAFAFGYPAIKDGPTALQSAQYETVAAGAKSRSVCVASGMGHQGFTQRIISWEVLYNGTPSVSGFILQGAIDDVDADYVTVDTSVLTATEVRQTGITNFRFFRVVAPVGLTTLGVIAKITCM